MGVTVGVRVWVEECYTNISFTQTRLLTSHCTHFWGREALFGIVKLNIVERLDTCSRHRKSMQWLCGVCVCTWQFLIKWYFQNGIWISYGSHTCHIDVPYWVDVSYYLWWMSNVIWGHERLNCENLVNTEYFKKEKFDACFIVFIERIYHHLKLKPFWSLINATQK